VCGYIFIELLMHFALGVFIFPNSLEDIDERKRIYINATWQISPEVG
jgi:hypothetical protein